MQKIRVMLVDDSAIVRGLMQRALKEDSSIEIVSTAVDGQAALDNLKRIPADIVILDIEMPVMDGLTTLPEILKISPKTRVIIASTLTLRNAEISIKAMELGASDYIAKPSARDGMEVEEFYRQLTAKIKALAPKSSAAATPTPFASTPARPAVHVSASTLATVKQITSPPLITALAIASSTGGPQALLAIFTQLKGRTLRTPIFITQHMPPSFTTILATHISKAIGCDCHEAVHGETVKPGVIYIAPGDYHMTVEKEGGVVKLKTDQGPQENFCRPAADPMLRSLAKAYGGGLLTLVLTGIGADGAKGASDVVSAGGTVIAQDEATSVVYGMPKAVADAKLTSAILPLAAIAPFLAKAVA